MHRGVRAEVVIAAVLLQSSVPKEQFISGFHSPVTSLSKETVPGQVGVLPELQLMQPEALVGEQPGFSEDQRLHVPCTLFSKAWSIVTVM